MNTVSFSPWPSIISLIIVLGIILAIGWLLKRSKIPLSHSPINMKTIAAHSLGPRERLVVIEIADQWHVIGVTSHSINSIAQLPKQTRDNTGSSAYGQNFLSSLQARLKK